MLPNVHVFGLNHVFIQIAANERQSVAYIHTEAGLKKIVDQALLALGLSASMFDPYANLIWVRWPQWGEKYPELKFPCIGEQYCPDEEADAEPGPSTADGIAQTPEEKGKKEEEKLPQVAPELEYIIRRQYFEKAEAFQKEFNQRPLHERIPGPWIVHD